MNGERSLGSVRPMAATDLDMVLLWRNHPDVRRWMYTTHEIGLDEHRRWFEDASKDRNRVLLVYELEGRATGFVNLGRIRGTDVAEWGFYLAPDAPAGAGAGLGAAALEHAFLVLGLHKISGHALAGNERSLRFHQRLGFGSEGVRRDHHLAADGVRHSVVCFGLLREEWLAARGAARK